MTPAGGDQATHARLGRLRRPSEESTAAGIYGILVGASVMAASHAERAGAVAVSVLVTLTVYWAAERYARLVADRIHAGHRPRWPQVRHQLTSGWEIVTASITPLAVLLVLGWLGVGVYRAVLGSLTCSTLLLCLAGWEIGRDRALSRAERITSAAVAGLFGVVLVVLKAVLH